MDVAPAGDGFYLAAEHVWVAGVDPQEWPLRQGDLLAAPPAAEDPWLAALLVHPTCELAKPSVQRLQVARVRRLDELADPRQRSRVVAGFEERDGAVRVAFAHTFFCPPVPESALPEPMWADLRDLALVDREQVTVERRDGTMSHEARVSFIRRYLYFRFRLLVPFAQVQALEAARIAVDSAFVGDKPGWVTETMLSDGTT